MILSIKPIDRYDPLTEADSNWLDKSAIFQSDRFQKIFGAKPAPEKQRPNPEDKLEHTEPISSYRPERALPNGENARTLREAREEYLQDERRQVEMSPLLRAYFRGGALGAQFDQMV
jgi:hypothetical protein